MINLTLSMTSPQTCKQYCNNTIKKNHPVVVPACLSANSRATVYCMRVSGLVPAAQNRRWREGDDVKEAGGSAWRCGVAFHAALSGLSTLKKNS